MNLLYISTICIALVFSHGSLVQPPPRNAIDNILPYWNQDPPSDWSHHVDTPICPVSESLHKLSLRQGQSCFWFSHGCTIFCDQCDGKTGRLPHQGTCGNENKVNATICDPKYRTINRYAPCGDVSDYYYYNPWRAPGSAPIFDACGMAGGSPVPVSNPAVGVRYKNTTNAKQGDRGTKVLPEAPTEVTWTVGELAEVSWAVRTNHGGGYQYRLCPLDEEITEECFQKTPLAFEGMSSLRWGGKNGKQLWFKGTYVSEGTIPKGSAWAMNPIPRVDSTQYPNVEDAFPAPCFDPNAPKEGGHGGLCSGWYGPDNLEIVDMVRIPKGLNPGKYVLGWRWDCEESAQVWQNCADITIVSKH